MKDNIIYGKYLVINAGSTSLKFQLLEMPQETLIAKGTIDRIGSSKSGCKFELNGEEFKYDRPIATHVEAAEVVLGELLQNGVINEINEIAAVGHRVVHGGVYYNDSIIVTDEVINRIKELGYLAPLHNPAQAATIESFVKLLPNVPQVAAFDTAFHQTMPEKFYKYGAPDEYEIESNIRKFGAHGLNVKYTSSRVPSYTGKKRNNIIVIHAGGGTSLSALEAGKTKNTTMGVTPNEGPMMMNRSSSICC